MKKLLALAICAIACSSSPVSVATASGQAVPNVIELVGAYSDTRQTNEGVNGHVLEVWRDGNNFIGRWVRAEGQSADFPMVFVKDLSWNAGGKVQFVAQWCDETESFAGVIKGNEVVGSLRNQSRSGTSETNVRLRKQSDYSMASMPKTEWQALMDALVKRTQPKC